MDSPESTKPGPSSAADAAAAAAAAAADAAAAAVPSPPTVVQDSPFFTYVSNLSPINTGNDGCSSTFRELKFPSPSPVFTSPHANPIRKGNLLKRCQYASPEPGKFSLKYVGNIKQFSENASLFGSNGFLVTSTPTSGIMKGSECESTQLQSCSSPSGCVDEFLADPMEDSIDSCTRSTPCSDQAAQLCGYSQDIATTDFAHSSACNLLQDAETGSNDDKRTSGPDPLNKNVRDNCRAEESFREDLFESNEPIGVADEDHMTGEEPLSQCSEPQTLSVNNVKVDKHEEIMPKLPCYQSSVVQNIDDECCVASRSMEDDTDRPSVENADSLQCSSQYNILHSTKNGIGLEMDHTPDVHADSIKVVHLDNNLDICGDSCNTSSENVISNGRGGFLSKLRSEGCQYQRAMCKRLEFDSGSSSLEKLSTSHAQSTKIIETSQSLTFSGHALSKSSSHLNVKSCPEIARSMRKDRSSLGCSVPRPSGIGLHLNSVVNVVSMNVHINVQSDVGSEKNNLRTTGDMEIHCSHQQMISDSNVCSASFSPTEDVSAKFSVDSHCLDNVPENSNGDEQGNQAMTVLSSSSGLPSCAGGLETDPIKTSTQLGFTDHCLSPCNVKLPSVEDACESEAQSETSPRKKRKKASEDGSCKRCNCKKSKCLKLYCDCFAAGVYCGDACACQGCLNRPAYEVTVLETRQQIENRNPLAFAPKVVVRTVEVVQSSGEENKGSNPTSARHKRGCNCKRSQCLKKYCECFQAKVGCSFGCRCEGCKNTYGKKDGVEVVETEHIKVEDVRCKNNSSDCSDVDINGEKLSNGRLLRHLSPFTPLQDYTSGASRSHYSARKYLSSAESSAAGLLCHGTSQRSPPSSGDTRFLKVIEGGSDQFLHSKELEIHDTDEVDLCSPKWEKVAQRCNLRLLSSSTPGEPTERKHYLRAPISQGGGHVSVGSLLWHNSPITPMPHFGESRLSLESCSDNEPLNAHEDDTPDILKDVCVPTKALKMSSPNKKRVSPPHKQVHEIKTSSSTRMRSRKFILKSVPSFPPLTPYGDNATGHET